MLCPHCGRVVGATLPIESHWTLVQIASMIPVNLGTLKQYILRNKADYGEAKYQTKASGTHKYRERVFSDSQVRQIAAYFIATRKETRARADDRRRHS